MSFVVKGKSSVYLKEETTEGVYEAPVATDAIEVLEDGLSFEMTRNEIERNLLSSTIEVQASRLGLKEVTGTVPVEFKAGATEGSAPRENVLYKSLMGGQRLLSAVTSLTGHTTTEIFIDEADVANFKKNDVVLIKQSGAHEVRPIAEVDDTLGAEKIVLAIPLTDAPDDGVEIAPCAVYFHQDAHPSFSATHYIGGDIKEEITGCRAVSATLESWEGGQTANMSFSVDALDLKQEAEALPPALVPDFSNDPLPPVILGACVWLNGVKVAYNSFSLNLENTKSDILSACSESGKIGSRYTQFVVTGEIAPYMDSDNVDRFESFEKNDDLSVFGYAYNPAQNAGEIQNVVAFWIPQSKITNMPNGDLEGIMTNEISFKAYRKEGEDSAFLAFI